MSEFVCENGQYFRVGPRGQRYPVGKVSVAAWDDTNVNPMQDLLALRGKAHDHNEQMKYWKAQSDIIASAELALVCDADLCTRIGSSALNNYPIPDSAFDGIK